MVQMVWTFGDRLRKARTTAGLGTRELATMLGVSHTTVSTWEIMGRTPRQVASLAAQVERLTGVSAKWLLFGCCEDGCKEAVVKT